VKQSVRNLQVAHEIWTSSPLGELTFSKTFDFLDPNTKHDCSVYISVRTQAESFWITLQECWCLMIRDMETMTDIGLCHPCWSKIRKDMRSFSGFPCLSKNFDWLIDWLIDLSDRLIDRCFLVSDRLIDRCFLVFSIDWSIGWSIHWSIDWRCFFPWYIQNMYPDLFPCIQKMLPSFFAASPAVFLFCFAILGFFPKVEVVWLRCCWIHCVKMPLKKMFVWYNSLCVWSALLAVDVRSVRWSLFRNWTSCVCFYKDNNVVWK
jgi:hypothetical protein